MLDHALLDALPGPITIRETRGKGQGAFATRPLAPGDVAVAGKPVAVSPERTWQTLQMDADTHVRMDEPFELVNHSCDPNCGVRPNRHGGYDLVARRAVAEGDEITFDYCMTEWEIVGFTDCLCGSERCRGVVRGAKHLPPETLEAYDGFLAPHVHASLPEPAGAACA